MEKSEPTLVPQWYRTGGVSSSNSNSNHRHSSSSNSDDQGVGLYARNRLSPSTSDRDSFQYSVLTDTTSNPSYDRSRSINGSMGYDRDSSTRSRPYNNFNRGYRDKGREKNIDSREKKSSSGLGNGYSDYTDIFPLGRIEKDTLPWSQSKVSGRHSEPQPKRLGNDLNNGVLSPKSLTGGINKSSFERDFPSLSVEEKLRPSEIGRVPPTSLNTVSQSLPLGTSVTIGGKGWTSALAEVPSIIGGNRPMVSSAQQSTIASSVSMAPGANTGLNMAETVAKALSSTRASPQLSDDTERLAELTRKQFRHLIPMTPSTPKSSVLNSLERLKSKGIKTGNTSMLTKFTLQTSFHPANHPNRGTARPDVSKTHQAGNFQVLNREKNSTTSTANRVPVPTITSKSATPVNAVPNPVMPSNPKPKHDGIQGCTTEKRLSAQDRMSFFNTIRNGSSANNIITSHQQCSAANSPTTEKSGKQTLMAKSSVCQAKEPSVLDSHPTNSMMNGNGTIANRDDLVDTEKLSSIDEGEESSTSYSDVPDEEEAKFLRSLGWKEGSEEALTPEEIDAFVRESGHLLNSFKMSYCNQN